MSENTESSFKVPLSTVKESAATENKEAKTDVPTSSQMHFLTEKQEYPYEEPEWSEKPDSSISYNFEVLKSGTIVEEIRDLQKKAFWVFGRLPNCDIVMAHPTISRYHAILQYKPKQSHNDASKEDDEKGASFGCGWYIFDLGSTHGTFLNKLRVPPKTYIQVKVGHMLRLGASTRNFILQGPEFDQEPESELTITELRELRQKQAENKRKEEEMQEMQREKEGINWGMAEDADEETDLTVNPYATTSNEDLFLDDPKKTLRGFFEREGLDLEYKADEMSAGTFVCRVELPIDDVNGRPLVAEVCHKGKKKECVMQCALEACRILDRHGLLRQSHHEPLKRKANTADSDDDDDFLDRTGDIERKKIRKAAATQKAVLTYDDLIKQEKEVLEKMSSVEESISKYQELSKRSKENMEMKSDDLDTFMTNLSEGSHFDKTEIRKLRVEQQRLKSEHEKLQRLLKIAKPVDLPSISSTTSAERFKKNSLMPLFGKRNKVKLLLPRSQTKIKPVEKDLRSDEEEMDDDEHHEESKISVRETTKEEGVSMSAKINANKASKTSDDSNNACILTENEDSNLDVNEEKRVIGPAFIPPDILSSSTQEDATYEEIENKGETENEIENKEDIAAMSKKRRSRIRIRTKGRENIDIDDVAEHDDVEKYSKWVPPKDQTGDGMTSLNAKFGY